MTLRLRPASIKPSVQLREPDEASAADLQGRKVALRQYSLNCSTAEPETLSRFMPIRALSISDCTWSFLSLHDLPHYPQRLRDQLLSKRKILGLVFQSPFRT
jgi:hypothetical protein